MTSENVAPGVSRDPELTSENTQARSARRYGRAPVELPGASAAVLRYYVAALAKAPLAAQTRRTYASRVRQYLAWLADFEADADPLVAAQGRDWAIRDYRTYLQAVLERRHPTVNNALAAVDDFYIRSGLGPGNAARVEIPAVAPRALDRRAQIRYLRAVEDCPSPRDQAIALVPFYAGTRISEIVALDVDDISRSARKGKLRIYGKGARVREVPIHPKLHKALDHWLSDRASWPGAAATPALFLNQRRGRLGVRSAHILRHTFATTLVRGGTDLVIVAELLGHARLETTRGYARSTAEDRVRA